MADPTFFDFTAIAAIAAFVIAVVTIFVTGFNFAIAIIDLIARVGAESFAVIARSLLTVLTAIGVTAFVALLAIVLTSVATLNLYAADAAFSRTGFIANPSLFDALAICCANIAIIFAFVADFAEFFSIDASVTAMRINAAFFRTAIWACRSSIERPVITCLTSIEMAVAAIRCRLTRLRAMSLIGMIIDIVGAIITGFTQIFIKDTVTTTFFRAKRRAVLFIVATPAVFNCALITTVVAVVIFIITFFARIDATITTVISSGNGIAVCPAIGAGTADIDAATGRTTVVIHLVTVITLLVAFDYFVSADRRTCTLLRAAIFIASPSIFDLALIATVVTVIIAIIASFARIEIAVSTFILNFNAYTGFTRFFALIPGFNVETIGRATVTTLIVAIVTGLANFDFFVTAIGSRRHFLDAVFGPLIAKLDRARR